MERFERAYHVWRLARIDLAKERVTAYTLGINPPRPLRTYTAAARALHFVRLWMEGGLQVLEWQADDLEHSFYDDLIEDATLRMTLLRSWPDTTNVREMQRRLVEDPGKWQICYMGPVLMELRELQVLGNTNTHWLRELRDMHNKANDMMRAFNDGYPILCFHAMFPETCRKLRRITARIMETRPRRLVVKQPSPIWVKSKVQMQKDLMELRAAWPRRRILGKQPQPVWVGVWRRV